MTSTASTTSGPAVAQAQGQATRQATGRAPVIRVWDWTVRVFHWGFAVLFAAMWWTAEEGHMDWHTRLGLFALGLLVFRLYWGLAGPVTARFARLVNGPGRIIGYVTQHLRRPYRPGFGHNPLGALSVMALLLAMAAVVGTGLFSADVNGFAEGPLAFLLDFGAAREAADLHELAFHGLQALVGLHLAAILLYGVVLRANLVGPMVTGRAAVATDAGEAGTGEVVTGEAGESVRASPLRVALGIGLALAMVGGVVWAGP